MPNLVMEYSHSVEKVVDVKNLLKSLHQVALSCGLFDAESVKSRSFSCQDWLIGDAGNNVDFIHVSFDLLDGRTKQQKQQLSCQLMATLQAQAGEVHSLTINIRDMDRECFQKVLN
ncbi:5-carboxymethyl-2-hydroxymuconate Delta-isomerase [Vibrio pectenicida]|uniref:5-carboxymethyl-2-hydroxymuconate Delta-isomerase n=1 Tax=Vibrio pectenicida TaxID=62763 RepID=A0A7Y3ZXA0_9VIBR|nr:5-carboxymethyl-2-hydroxymuconate Delta-isomerase [Vibrio pectenicida]NOH70811.1 5-carboxymethyl-2-hydroxymuconate Delta-isomerase [Vibrio pectenicida]